MVKNPLASAGGIRDMNSIPGSGRFPGGGQPIPVFLSGESHRQRSLASYSPGGRKDSDTIEQLNNDDLSGYQP